MMAALQGAHAHAACFAGLSMYDCLDHGLQPGMLSATICNQADLITRPVQCLRLDIQEGQGEASEACLRRHCSNQGF